MKIFLEKLNKKQDLTFNESKAAFEILMSGKATEGEIFNFLTLLSAKGEVSSEIAGGVFVLRNKSKRVNVNNCIDTCGTGGDGKNTLNISTASALLLASMGIKVAKHGNKAVSSKCGSGDVLEALNIKIDLEPKDIEEQISGVIAMCLTTGKVNLDVVATTMGYSSRTLHRRLNAASISFRTTLDAVRLSQANQYLNSTHYKLSDIAALLGYSNQSAFTRSYIRWCGISPSQHRTLLSGTP